MIDLKDLRQNPDKYRKGAADKRIDVDVQALIELDAELRAAMTEREQLTAEKNRIGKEIGQLAGQLKKAQGNDKAPLQSRMQALQCKPSELKEREQQLQQIIAEMEPRRDELWLQMPQPAAPDVPVGRGAEDNVEISRWNPPWFDPAKSFEANKGFKPRTHMELMEHHAMVHFERGVKIAGSRSYVLTGAGAKLHQAILRFAFDYMTDKNGFTPVTVPVFARGEMMVGTGFFPHGKEQAYQIANPTSEAELYLTGTGEVGLMGLHQNEIVDADQLPLRYTTMSTCFRREAGAAGKETAGLYRIHQFDKVEQVVICRADENESRQWHQKMIGFVQTMLEQLEIPHRLLQCCTGDLGPKNADMIDIESWMPSRGIPDATGVAGGDWGETHSASRLYDYQCRRLNLRYRDPQTQKPVVAHSLNNTVAASPRILIPILELYQNADRSITVPPALRPYMHGLERIG